MRKKQLWLGTLAVGTLYFLGFGGCVNELLFSVAPLIN